MLHDFSHESLCQSKLVHLAVEGKTFTKEKEIIYEMKVVKNSGSIYLIKRSNRDLERFRKAVKKIAKEHSMRKLIITQDALKKLVADKKIPAQLKSFEKILGELWSHEEISNSQIAQEFIEPEDWCCTECKRNVESCLDKEPKFNKSVVSKPFNYPKYKIIKNDGLPSQFNQNLPAIDEVVDVFSKNLSGWWHVLYKKKLMCYPSSYLVPFDQQISHVEDDPFPLETPQMFIAKKSFSAGNCDEISFNERDLVLVLQMHYDGWWTVEIDGRKGLAPSVYLERKSVEDERLLNHGFQPEVQGNSKNTS